MILVQISCETGKMSLLKMQLKSFPKAGMPEKAKPMKKKWSKIAMICSPKIINSAQGVQFTSAEYTNYLKNNCIKQSMDGKARWVDNVIIERWFRSFKTEYIYINELKKKIS